MLDDTAAQFAGTGAIGAVLLLTVSGTGVAVDVAWETVDGAASARCHAGIDCGVVEVVVGGAVCGPGVVELAMELSGRCQEGMPGVVGVCGKCLRLNRLVLIVDSSPRR